MTSGERFSFPERVVNVRQARFRYPDGTAVLEGFDFEVAPGEIVAVLGPNGAGKTTLLRLVAAGRRGATDPPGPPGVVGAVFDTPAFQDALSIRDNLVWYARLRGIPIDRARERAAKWLTRFELDEWAGRPAGACSFGTRRRLALAEAFAVDPRLLLLDEPLAGLDPRARELLADLLTGARSGGASAIIALHDPEFAGRIADRVAFLDGGRIVGAGAPGALVAELGLPLRFEITSGPGPGIELDFRTLPAGLAASRPVNEDPRWSAAVNGEVLTLAAPGGPDRLPAALDWVAAQGRSVRTVRVREPGLADVFIRLTGRALDESPSP